MIMQAGRTSSQQNLDAEHQLEDRLQQFDLWATETDQLEDGWEGYFPQWHELDQAAKKVMSEAHPSESALFLLGRCWAISEEDETCADWARQHLQDSYVRELVRRLTVSAEPRTRWQACNVLGDLPILDADTVQALEAGMTDEDSYVRRRAFLALVRHIGGVDIQPYYRQMLSDIDTYNRYVAMQGYDAMRLVPEALRDLMQATAQDPAVARLLASNE